MTAPQPDAPVGARRRADAMVGMFVAAGVALLGAAAVLFTNGSGAIAAALVVVAVVAAVAAVVLLRSISPEERAKLTAPKPDPDPDERAPE